MPLQLRQQSQQQNKLFSHVAYIYLCCNIKIIIFTYKMIMEFFQSSIPFFFIHIFHLQNWIMNQYIYLYCILLLPLWNCTKNEILSRILLLFFFTLLLNCYWIFFPVLNNIFCIFSYTFKIYTQLIRNTLKEEEEEKKNSIKRYTLNTCTHTHAHTHTLCVGVCFVDRIFVFILNKIPINYYYTAI